VDRGVIATTAPDDAKKGGSCCRWRKTACTACA